MVCTHSSSSSSGPFYVQHVHSLSLVSLTLFSTQFISEPLSSALVGEQGEFQHLFQKCESISFDDSYDALIFDLIYGRFSFVRYICPKNALILTLSPQNEFTAVFVLLSFFIFHYSVPSPPSASPLLFTEMLNSSVFTTSTPLTPTFRTCLLFFVCVSCSYCLS